MLVKMTLRGCKIEINKLHIIMEDAMNGEQKAIQILNDIKRNLDMDQEKRV
ncbi:hypothetical protein V7095_07495 [Bacillus thuringiensis]|uniref:hypothetical protein n=1 Tax=Bacillus thuringiensis TaxID=1428 RepID=UPI00159684E9|nr:hypothetical protein [Bacillus thuringiensis]